MGTDAETVMPATTAKISAEATAEAATVNGDMLPAMTIDMGYSLKREAYFQKEMQKQLNKGQPGVYGDLKETFAYQSMKRQLDGYVKEGAAFPKAEQTYNMFVSSANLAVRMFTKMDSLGARVGIDADTDVTKLLTSGQKKALGAAVKKNMTSLPDATSVTNMRTAFEGARLALVGSSREMQSLMYGDIIGELQKQIQADQGKKDEIQAKIAKVAAIAGYIQTAASLVAAGAGALAVPTELAVTTPTMADPAMGTLKAGADKAGSGAGMLGKAVGIGMELYYAKDLQNLQDKIDTTTDLKTSLEGVAAATKIDGIKIKFAASLITFKAAADQYAGALRDREVAYAKIAADADASLETKKGGPKDDISQILLFIASARETHQTLQSGVTSGQTAKGAMAEAFDATKHRGEDYQTNYESSSAIRLNEDTDTPDYRALNQMSKLTNAWLGKAEISTKVVANHEANGAKVMADAGSNGSY